MKLPKRPLLGMCLFALFALAMLLGARYGPRAARKLGLDPLRQPLPILLYHNVVPDGGEVNDMTVTVSRLRQDFQYLRESGCTPILPRDLASGERLPEKAVLITFDDGYRSNYDLLFPLLQEYGMKAVILPIVRMTDEYADDFCSWRMYREMEESGLVEVGSHSWNLHNTDGRGGVYTPDRPNGIQALPGEPEEDFQSRVLDDLRKSYDRIEAELGHPPACFTYPYGVREERAQAFVDQLFPMTMTTWPGTAELADGLHDLPRWTVAMGTDLAEILGVK